MSRHWIPWAVAGVLLAALIASVAASARSLRPSPAPPTADLAQVQTQAVATFAGGLTSTAQVVPMSTASETPVPTQETAATEATAATDATAAESPTPSCYRLKYVRDVTIPDNTLMTPAQVFTKTWQVENSGTCPWRPGFKMALVGGVAMGGSPFVLEATVNPGARIDISIRMVAPTNQTGIIQGTWRMEEAAGAPFGDALTAIIVVGGSTLVPPTVEVAPTP